MQAFVWSEAFPALFEAVLTGCGHVDPGIILGHPRLFRSDSSFLAFPRLYTTPRGP